MLRFSVIIPCFNAASYVGGAVASCLAQTAADLEVLVVDDGSSDDSAAAATAAAAGDPRVRVLTQRNQGVGAARNAGLAVARGEFVSFLDADDEIEPEKLAVQGAVLEENPGIGLVLCDGSVIDRAGQMTWPTLVDARRFAGHPSLFDLCFRGGSFPPVVPLVRRSLAMAVGGFDEDRTVRGWADVDFWMRLGLSGADYYFVEQRLVRYRSTTDSMSADREGMEEAARTVYARTMAKHPVESARALRAAHGRLRDLEAAADQLRTAIGVLAGEQEPRETVAQWRVWNDQLHKSRAAALRTLLALWARHKGSPDARPLVIWGAGSAGRAVLALLRDAGAVAEAFIDSDLAKMGLRVDGLPVVAPPDVASVAGPRPFVLIASLHAVQIASRLQVLGWRQGGDYHVADFDAAAVSQNGPAAPVERVLSLL
jgi:GT2 family glycosyltransferase